MVYLTSIHIARVNRGWIVTTRFEDVEGQQLDGEQSVFTDSASLVEYVTKTIRADDPPFIGDR